VVGWDPGAASDVDSRISAARLRTEAWTVVEARRFSAASRGANAGGFSPSGATGPEGRGCGSRTQPYRAALPQTAHPHARLGTGRPG
jgi:hypothetical protein